MYPQERRDATPWRTAAVSIVFTVLLSACSDSVPTPPSAVSVRQPVAQQRLGGPTNAEIPRFPEPADFISETVVSDPNAFRELPDNELIEAVRRAGGRVSIGLKPVASVRTSESRIIPAITRSEIQTARAILDQHGVRTVRAFRNFAALLAEIDPAEAPLIRQLSVVNYVEAELPGRALAQDTSWGVKKIGSHLAWATGHRGQQSFVTILDFGLDLTHISSGDGPAGFNGDCYFTVTDTCYWTATAHGVLVAGVIAGRDNEQGYIGVANQLANFASIKVFDNDLNVQPGSVAAGLDWAISTGYPRHIVNMSLGWCDSFSVLAEAVQRTANAGILMVAAVGNTNVDCGSLAGVPLVMYPARYGEVIGVSGTTEDDTFWSGDRSPCGTVGSMHGHGVELSAPFWAWSMIGNGEYYFNCFTSFSAAAVTGVAALAWTKHPTWTAGQIRDHLRTSVVDRGPAGYDYEFGYGRVDAAAAVRDEPPPPPPPSVSVTITGTTEIRASQGCSWYAVVSNGTAPYSYAWRVGRQSVGTDSPDLWYENNGSPFTLSVTVTDANGQVASDDHSVSINPDAYCL